MQNSTLLAQPPASEEEAAGFDGSPTSSRHLHQWYLCLVDDEIGPIEEPEMTDYFRGGRIDAQTRVWRAGMPDWQPLFQVPELRHFLEAFPDHDASGQDAPTAADDLDPSSSWSTHPRDARYRRKRRRKSSQNEDPGWLPSAAISLSQLERDILPPTVEHATDHPEASDHSHDAAGDDPDPLGLYHRSVTRPSVPLPILKTFRETLPWNVPERRRRGRSSGTPMMVLAVVSVSALSAALALVVDNHGRSWMDAIRRHATWAVTNASELTGRSETEPSETPAAATLASLLPTPNAADAPEPPNAESSATASPSKPALKSSESSESSEGSESSESKNASSKSLNSSKSRNTKSKSAAKPRRRTRPSKSVARTAKTSTPAPAPAQPPKDPRPRQLTVEQVVAGVKKQAMTLASCFRRAIDHREIKPGRYKLVLDWVIRPDGRVRTVRMREPAVFRRTSLSRCVPAVIAKWRFPESRRAMPVRNFPLGPINVL